jgi:hypothetical protein
VKRFVDPTTAKKIVILTADEVLPTLTHSIDLENIPVQYGGGFHFKQGMVPDLDEGLNGRLEWLEEGERPIPTGPLKWRIGRDGDKVRNLVFAKLVIDDANVDRNHVNESGFKRVLQSEDF